MGIMAMACTLSGRWRRAVADANFEVRLVEPDHHSDMGTDAGELGGRHGGHARCRLTGMVFLPTALC
jgi:hypothetical protein